MNKTCLAFSLLILLLICSVTDACPTCKLALEGGPDHTQQGYAYSIMFMMAMPFLIATGWAIFVYRCVVHQRKMDAEKKLVDDFVFDG